VSLIERSRELAAQLHRLGQLKDHASQAVHFEKRADELTIAASQLIPVSKTFEVLKALNLDFQSLAELSLSAWNFRFSELRSRYALDAQCILDPTPGEDARAVFLNPLKNLPVKIRTALTLEWAAWSKLQIPPISDDLLSVLAAVGSMKPKVEKLRVLKRTAVDTTARLPASKADLDAFLVGIASIRQAWEDLAGDGIPKEVIDFLRAAGRSDGAPVEQLTSPILEWLRTHHLDQTLRIRMI